MKETLEMALEALEFSAEFVDRHSDSWQDLAKIRAASAALKRSLAELTPMSSLGCENQGEPIAWYNPQNFDPGQSVTFDRAKHDKWPHLFPAPLYACTPTIPEGWQLVPIEPTDAMFAAGGQFMECTSSLGEAWEAMLAAAPKGDKP